MAKRINIPNVTGNITITVRTSAIENSDSVIAKNEVPYISTYHIKPIVKPNEEVIIDYYITDYYHKEYVNEDYSEIFTVTVRVEGKDDIIVEGLQAGDHSISLGTFPELDGVEQKFSILCTDQYGRNSHELFNFFLVRNDVPVKEYVMTNEDLETYNISNTNDITKIADTRDGLQRLLDDKQLEGYNKLKLLEGTYRIDHIAPIYIPTRFTLDMNGATLKLHEFTGNKALMIELNNTFDSHVINGTIEGDRVNHDYDNSTDNSEWVNGISMGNECKYSSYENLTIKDITGYGTINGIKNYRNSSVGYIYNAGDSGGNIDTFNLGDIDRNTGMDIPSKNRTTSDFKDISGFSQIGYLSVSVYLGYQGCPCGTWNIICHFYDDNKNFIKSVDSYLYRRVGVPNNAHFVRVTILNEAYPTNLSILLYRVPTHCWHKNLYLEECRAVGMAPQGMNNMLFEDCELTKCGSAVTKCALDAEDGWDTMQDATFRRLNFHDNYYNNFVTCAGHNFILDNCNCGFYIWGRTRNLVVMNSNCNGRIHNDGLVRTGIPRVINNTINSNLEFANSDETLMSNSLIRNCTFNGGIVQTGLAYNCTFNNPSGYMKNITLNNCLINNINAYINENAYFNDCTFDGNEKYILRFNHDTGYREFNNCTFKNSTSLAGNYFGKGIFNNCNFDDIVINVNTPNNLNDLIFSNCELNFSTSLINLSSSSYIVFNYCTITDKVNSSSALVYLNKEPSYGQSIFTNCTITKNEGCILDGYYAPGYINENASYEVIFNNSPLSIQSLSDKYANSTLQFYKVIFTD